MRALLAVIVAAVLAGGVRAAAPEPPPVPPESAGAWIKLFDGETTFGWAASPGATLSVKNGEMTLTAGKEAATATFTLPLPAFEIEADTRSSFLLLKAGVQQLHAKPRATFSDTLVRGRVSVADGILTTDISLGGGMAGDPLHVLVGTPDAVGPITVGVYAAPNSVAVLRTLRVRPTTTKPIFDGKTVAGWTPYKGDAKRELSQFSVTPAGELQVKSGPGDLRTDAAYDDFLLQFRCKTNGPALNSGVFFRCIPGEYQNGYEAQIQNAYKDNDRTKPADFGTGAIYRRVPARKVVSNDKEYFTFTVLAAGPRIATWVDGYPTVNWLDDRKPDDNPRKGLRTKAGHLSIQGHDPTTDIVFKDIRVATLK